ncbi:UDP-4-amino-4,6-dideoxy-N-acetyl-beta-L-altrosamine N-acetyltransferase [Paenibacillus tepidiphilus]|uniref:UDP-4-amino-4, 6-dideoxy-N-acetyl-beta-L-altrosamine N-acetyltransferase n=1 Tax=Paenibacillus tepidiphilus TaxID=2608683 RepID=UPI00123B49B2|nr:UDP-4-amino-4,6-dideoxy-N-acetyl-beta-L-altrosamine N-acetyltransferase [Paenibacillus tepidiphilus]
MAAIKDYRLENLDEKRLLLVWEWRNADHIRRFMNHDDLIPLENHYRWWEAVVRDASKQVKLCFYQEQPIGLINFTQIDHRNQTCDWGLYIGDRSSPSGSGKIMGILALDYIFKERQLRKVCAQILDFNGRSLSYHQRLGFTEEGRLRQQIVKNNTYADLVLMSIFQEQWENHSSLLKEEVMRANERNSDR